jgi:hypothetical protein
MVQHIHEFWDKKPEELYALSTYPWGGILIIMIAS